MKFIFYKHLILLVFSVLLIESVFSIKVKKNSNRKSKMKKDGKTCFYLDFYGVDLNGPAGRVFEDMFGKNWNKVSHNGELYRGEFLNKGYNQYFGGMGYGNSDKYMADLRKLQTN